MNKNFWFNKHEVKKVTKLYSDVFLCHSTNTGNRPLFLIISKYYVIY